ncbi:MAG: SUMF1/EgtB/PvdO family nonheme iron enzyme [Verrucomicrobiales bacterium]|nr:SUMF1/EgtB/PvdO family nonheme iron enzyme [Verrucomicrobiales bacterium]
MDDDERRSAELSAFLKKALEIELEEGGKQLDEEALRKIALKSGLTEADWEKLGERLNEHSVRGRNFLEQGNFEEAVVDLEEAVILAPYSADILYACGLAHLGLWQKSGKESDRVRADELFRKCLELEPSHAGAAEGITELARAKNPKRKKKWAAVGAALLLVSIGLGASQLSSSPIFERQGTRDMPVAVGELGPTMSPHSEGKYHVNSIGLKFAPVPIVGGPGDGTEVLFSIWETRNEDYTRFLIDNPKHGWAKPDFGQTGDHPVVFVSWNDAVAFCDWLTKVERKKGFIGENQRYRLPTDHEWSCAMGIGGEEDAGMLPVEKDTNGPLFPWGRQYPPPVGAGNFFGEECRDAPLPNAPNRKVVTNYNDGYTRTAPVGSFSPNQFGLYDLSGNVWEWCDDWYSGEKINRVRRGSSWIDFAPGSIKLSERLRGLPGSGTRADGFRCVLVTDDIEDGE